MKNIFIVFTTLIIGSSAFALECSVTSETHTLNLPRQTDRNFPDFYAQVNGYDIETMILNKNILVLSIINSKTGHFARQTIYGFKENSAMSFQQYLNIDDQTFTLHCK